MENKLYNAFPIIDVNFISNEVTIEGNSIPENGIMAYRDFLKELKFYTLNWPKLTINFKFNIYNTSTTMHISTIMSMCNSMAKTKEVIVNWFYLESDTDMFEAGEDYKETFKFINNFNLIKIK